ncbi:hypothetical protein HPB49_001081 [Dermacentor silvarum]|uniref:Uncharacterized protein n=1 Tax=Dermacentor silvarum TaxID=543639 RepID=A0ACB8CIS5_DERSI|nr:hypothetical protein HPB49_001081 [Dermacentor silvarum]
MRSIYCRAPGHSFFPSSNFNECMYKDANVHPRVSLHTASAPNGQQSRISHASSLNSDHCARNREKRAAASQEELGGERTFAHGWQAPSRRGPKRARPCLVMPAHGAVVCVRSVFLRPPSGLRRFESDVAQTGVVVHACSRSRRNMRLCARASQTLCMQAGVGGWTDRMRCSKARSEPKHTLAFGAHTCALSTKRISQADQVQPTYDYMDTLAVYRSVDAVIIVAVDAASPEWTEHPLATSEIAGMPVTARLPGDRSQSSGVVKGVYGNNADEDLLAVVSSKVRVVAAKRQGITLVLRFAVPPPLPPQGSTSSACPSRYGSPGLALCSAFVAGATGMPQQPAGDRCGACGAMAHTRRNRSARAGSDACIVGDHIQPTRLTASYGRESGAWPP